MNKFTKYTTREQIVERAKSAINHKIGDFNDGRFSLGKSFKGSIGQIIEEGVFGYDINSRSEPDFNEVGVELKVTGLKYNNQNKYVPKERLVLNMINYKKEAGISFEESSFWKKNKTLFFMFYLYDKNKDFSDFLIIGYQMFDFPPEDLFIIKNDWKIINDKINSGNAELISEADTMYLGACTKAANAKNGFTNQPFSHELAKRRAYCLKSSYFTKLVSDWNVTDRCERILSLNEIKEGTFEIAMQNKITKYVGKTIKEISCSIGYQISAAKNQLSLLISKMFGIYGKINDTSEFKKANMELKIIKIMKNGHIKEQMSFSAFNFIELSNEEWETSKLRNYFYNKRFAFAIFIEKNNGDVVFDRIHFWNMPLKTIDKELYKVWYETKQILLHGNIVESIEEKKNGTIIHHSNFPKISENFICHVRPHGKNFKDTNKLPVKDILTGYEEYEKQCFWINGKYLMEQIKEN